MSDFNTEPEDEFPIIGLTEKGLKRIIDISLMVDEGKTVEEISDHFDMTVEEFQVFYTVCNMSGIMDMLEEAKKGTIENA